MWLSFCGDLLSFLVALVLWDECGVAAVADAGEERAGGHVASSLAGHEAVECSCYCYVHYVLHVQVVMVM
jgi:hypothetical protein